MPIHAKIIWKPSERAICERAAKKSSIGLDKRGLLVFCLVKIQPI